MKHEERAYGQFGRCLFLSNGTLELAVTLDVGPRVIRLGFCGGGNVFYEQPKDADYLCTPEGWRVYGGHRLSWAPESGRNYWPDNGPVGYELLPEGVLVSQAEDEHLKLAKSMRVEFGASPYEVRVTHSVRSTAAEPVKGALWAISAMAPGGCLEAAFARSGPAYAPERSLSVWGNTRMTDERLEWLDDGVRVACLPSDEYFKLGLLCREGEACYRRDGLVFVKTFDGGGALYPDGNVNLEVYACRHMLEFETLSPLLALEPDGAAEHVETWNLFRQG